MLQQYCMLKREIWICLNTQLPFAVLLILLFFFWIFLVSANMRLHVQALSLRILLFFFDFPFGPLFLPFPYVSCPLSPSSFFFPHGPMAEMWYVHSTQKRKEVDGPQKHREKSILENSGVRNTQNTRFNTWQNTSHWNYSILKTTTRRIGVDRSQTARKRK